MGHDLSDTTSICVLHYFLQNIEDPEIKILVEHALELSQQHVAIFKEMFINENISVTHGFTEQDVNLKSERQFSDIFHLKYLNYRPLNCSFEPFEVGDVWENTKLKRLFH
ncbi:MULTISPECIES: DUF3231 family protein [unclassified Mesobacillus]|jgi:hypothetical protein|uniref:DUF3231 family protein n=1 Tax=unclassified Mesobacillus TaxID=2675270 RepID=UPI00333FB5AA